WTIAQNLDTKDETEVQIFYSVHDPLRHYRCQIPELLGKHIRGCFYGWVIFFDHPHNVMWSLWNPITSKVINLPLYASVIAAKLVVELTIVVKDNGVAINLLSLLMLPDLSLYGHKRRAYLVGTCKDLFCICIDFDEVTETIGDVYLFKLDINSKNWEELRDATIILEIDGYLYPEYQSCNWIRVGGIYTYSR
ncbi:hypothetical protein Tco_1414852, partial [Tanacetum coccineum]